MPIPFGNASPDQVGVSRTSEQEAFVAALAAPDLKTGQLKWKLQTSHHDLWDRDNPSQPVLLNPPKNGVDQMACRTTYNQYRYDCNPWTLPTTTGSLVWPGNIGVFNWGSIAVDPVNKWLIGTPQYLAYLYQLFRRPAGQLDKRMFGGDNSGVRVGVDLTTGKTA